MTVTFAGGGGDRDGLTLAAQIGQANRLVGGFFRIGRLCIDGFFIAVSMGCLDCDLLCGHGGLAVRDHAVIQIITILAAGFRRNQNGECGGMRAAELTAEHPVFQLCRCFVLIDSVPLIGIASRTALNGDGESHRMMVEPEQTVGGIFIIIYGNAGGAANGSRLPGNIQLVAHAVAAHGAHAVAVIAVSGQTRTVGCPKFLVFVLVAQTAIPPVGVLVMAPAVAGEGIVVVKVGMILVFLFQMLLKIGVVAAPDIAAAAVAAQGVGQILAAVLAAKFAGCFASLTEGHIVEAAAAVDAEMILVLVVILAHLFGALAGQLAAIRAADDTGIKAGVAQTVLIFKKLSAALADAVDPIGAVHADLAALAARHHRVELAALHAQAAVGAGFQSVARNALAALLTWLAAFFAMIVFQELALFGDLIAVAAFRTVHSVRFVTGAVLAHVALRADGRAELAPAAVAAEHIIGTVVHPAHIALRAVADLGHTFLAQTALVAGIVAVQAPAAAVAVGLQRTPVVGAGRATGTALVHVFVPMVVTAVPALVTVFVGGICCCRHNRHNHDKCEQQAQPFVRFFHSVSSLIPFGIAKFFAVYFISLPQRKPGGCVFALVL